MKKSFYIALFLIYAFAFCPQKSTAFMVKYKEDWWNLYHIHYQQYSDDCIENIYYLEKAVRADFANPMYALIQIDDEKSYEKYRYLFLMHLNLKLCEQHMRLGRIYDKEVCRFYDAPWKDEYISDLDKTLVCYNTALAYWQEASLWAEKASGASFGFLNLSQMQNWEDERERIKTGSLRLDSMITREIKRVGSVRQAFANKKQENP